MTDISAAEARKHLSEILNRVAYTKERVVLTRHGNQIAAIVPLEDLDLLTQLQSVVESRDVEDALAESDKGVTVPWTDRKGERGLRPGPLPHLPHGTWSSARTRRTQFAKQRFR